MTFFWYIDSVCFFFNINIIAVPLEVVSIKTADSLERALIPDWISALVTQQ